MRCSARQHIIPNVCGFDGRQFFLSLALGCALLANISAYAQNNDTSKLATLRDEIVKLEEKLQAAASRETETLAYLDDVERKIDLTQKYVAELKREVGQQRSRIQTLQKQQVELENELQRLKASYTDRIVSLYKHGRIVSLPLLLSVDSFRQVQLWAEYQRRLAAHDARRIEKIEATRDDLQQTRQKLAQAFRREQGLLKERETEEQRLIADRKGKRQLLNKLRDDRRTYERQIEDYKAEIEKIQRLIATAERKKQVRPQDDFILPQGTAFNAMKGGLPWPVRGTIARAYGPYQHPVLKTVTSNLGIDIEVPLGTEVHAVAPGKVTAITWQRGRGNLIIINHGEGFYTVYTHIDDILVQLDQPVIAGQTIGTVGDAGAIDSPRLHFQIWNKFDHLDPMDWLKP